MKSALKIPRYYVSLSKTKAMYAASERQYTGAGGEVQVPRGGFTSDRKRNEEIYTPVAAWVLSLCSHKMEAFKHRKAVSFQIGLCSDPYLWSWILGNDRKNINSGVSAKDKIFAKSPRCDKGAYGG